MKKWISIFFIFVIFTPLMGQTNVSFSTDELELIKEHYRNFLLGKENSADNLVRQLASLKKETEMSDQAVLELHQRYPLDIKAIQLYIKALRPDGSWPDINYADVKRSGWEPKLHAERILELCKLYNSNGTKYYHSKQLAKTIHSALNYWFSQKLMCKNWWYNEIGIPKTLGSAFILFEKQLNEDEMQSAIRVMNNSKFGMTGQNKVWLAGNVLIRGLLQHDFALVKAARDTIVSEIVTDRMEGIKADWSFHQHGAQQQFGNYGLSYITGMSFFSGLFSGTSLALSSYQQNILTSLIDKGYRWVIWHGAMDVNALGRQFFHNAPIHKVFSLAFAMKELKDSSFEPLEMKNSFIGHKHFWNSDLTVHRSPEWMASVKLSSNRVIGSEGVNEDNLQGYYLADGATYIYVDGNEYLNIYPFWDWRKIPGITSYDTSLPLPNLRTHKYKHPADFVGGVTDGKLGLTSMKFNRDGLRANKSWIFTDQFVLCLGSAISSDSTLAVTTSIEQCAKNGELIRMANDQRFFHNHTGYILLQPDKIVATVEKRKGRWCDVMQMYKAEVLENEVVSIYLNHGKSPNDESYQYLILPASSANKVKQFDIQSIQVIRNDKSAQAVSLDNGHLFFVSAYDKVNLSLDKETDFTADSTGLFIIRRTIQGWVINVSDPTQLLSTLSFRINDSLHQVKLPEGENKGTSVELIFNNSSFKESCE